MSDNEKFGFKLSNEEYTQIINHNIKDSCLLNESQLDVYMDATHNSTGTYYNNPFKIKLNNSYSVNDIKKVINKLYDLFPVLSARVIQDDENVSFAFDADLDVIVGSHDDVDSFVSSFNLEKSLSKFFIVKNSNVNLLYIDLHQLIFDYSSLNIIVDNLLALLNGEEMDYVDEGFLRRISLEDFIVDSEYKNNAEKFYEAILNDCDDVSELLPSIKKRKNTDFKYTTSFDIDSNYINSFLDNHSISINQFFTSVFAYTLSRFTESSKVLFNLAEDVRSQIDSLNSVGNFTRSLPLIFDCKNQNIHSYLKYTSNLINSSKNYIFYPFNILEKEYGLNSNIQFQYTSKIRDDIDELKHDFAYDLLFYISYEDSVEIKVLYSDKYSFELIERIIKAYKSILFNMMEMDELSHINYTSSSDLELLDFYNQTENTLNYGDILDAFNDNLKSNPENNLVSFIDESYTYGEGAYIADKLAKRLAYLGVNADDKVAFLTERCEHYMFCVLGVLSMGSIYVPLDDKLPDDRIKFILEDTDARAVIVSDETYKRMSDLTDRAILNISDIVNDDIGSLKCLPVVYGNLACILYTSGTTGLPKGVKITRKSLINVCEDYIEKYGLDTNDVYGLPSAIGFDMSNFVISVVLSAGACLAVVPEDIRFNMMELNRYFISHNVSHAFITTQVGKLFMETIDKTSLDVILLVGEKLGEFNSPEDYILIDAYGPTESFAYITSIDNSKKIDYSSVGFLNSNVKVYILDDELRRVPIGAIGQLYIAGDQLADGYLNRETETNNAFIDNPYDNEDYGVLYRTGDMVRILPDGSLGILGRRDTQVKIRGNRVELSEIEAVIREVDSVDDVTVQTVENDSNNELVAYIVSNESNNNGIEDKIRSYVLNNKPDYMVPSFIIFIEEIPLTVNGKVDKRNLPEIDLDCLHEEYVAPRTKEEKVVVKAFETVLNRERVGLNDDFTRLGGDSLSAIKLLSYLEGYNITAADIFSLRTPLEISKSLSKFDFDLDTYSLESGCPLNESQLNVYLDIIAHNKVDLYTIPLSMSISKQHSKEDLIAALDVMINVHPILGMCVSDEFDLPYLVKGNKPEISIESSISDKFLTKSFNLNESLSRFLIIENEDEYKLCGVFHHIIFDGISIGVFKKDLLAILNGENIDVDDSFLKVSSFTSQIKESREYNESKEFYDSMLIDANEVGVLLGDVCADESGRYEYDLNLDKQLFNEFIAQHDISENVLFTGVFAYTLSRFAGNDKILFNIIENGRDRFNNFDSIGMYVNTLPILVDCKNQDLISFMNHVSNRIYDVMKYDYYPFRLLAKEYNLHPDILFQYLPNWFNINENASYDNITISEIEDRIGDFSFNIIQMDENYKVLINYSEKYSKDTVERFVQSYNMILSQIIKQTELSEINYITNSDLKLLDNYNQTEHDLTYCDVLDAFNDNLLKYPNNNLVSFNDVSYSYVEGAFIAGKIAEKLIGIGVKSQDKVSFLVERSELYMFCILGILSCGSVYVPLDDEYPNERITFMLKDTRSKVIIVIDETYERAKELAGEEITLLNISNILKGDIGSSYNLPVIYGDLACILYTSGSTGLPKGVNITRKAILNFVDFYIDDSNISDSDVYGLFASIGFDVAIKGIFSSIYSGACLNVVPNEIKLDMNALNNHFIKYGVTHTHITTQVAKLFISNVGDSSLKTLVTGGEKLGEVEYPKNYKLIDTYGPTEACVYVTSIDEIDKIDSSSVGNLLNNIKAYILDDDGRRVPIGAVGELCVAGSQVAKGYLNRQKETDESFTINPFDCNENYNVLYHTGDLARILPDGSLSIVGRQDSQVKIRGNRVELTEVESVIRNINFVEEVSVQTVNNRDNNELVAYVVADDEIMDNNLQKRICDYVSSHKPDYMVPSFIVFIDEIPLTVNGKVDKDALPEIDLDSLHTDYVAPKTKDEKLIAEAFEYVLNQEHIGLYDDFVRLGGDSISAIRVISLLQNDGVSCTARNLLKYKTPYLIAQNLEEFERVVSYDAVQGEVDLLPIQSFFFDQINKNENSQQFILKSKENLDIDVLQNALWELSNIHDMLRAVYYEDDRGNPVQKILPLDSHLFRVNEYTMLDLNKEFNQVFINSIHSLNIHNKLIDVSLIHCNGDDYVLFVIHHLIVDGVSWNILLEDLTYIYDCLVEGKNINLLRPYPYKNWVEDVKNLVYNISDEEKQHWIEVNDLLDDSDIKGKVNSYSFNIKCRYDSDNLLFLSEEEYWALAIARAYKKTYGKDIIFNRESHGRDDIISNLNRTIGWFTSKYPVIVNVTTDNDNFSLIKDVYALKKAFNDINNLGLNYESLIYITEDLEYKYCPVTFNFLSDEFVFENKLFKSISGNLDSNEELSINQYGGEDYGISFNISQVDGMYLVAGFYAENTYIGDNYHSFVENIKEELKFITDYDYINNIVCCLSEPQMGVYLDELVNDMDTAYSTVTKYECDLNASVDDIKNVIYSIIDKHPVLKGRILNDGNMVFLVCDSYPLIEVVNSDDTSSLIEPFDLEKYLARFYIIDTPKCKAVFADIHHIISDATTLSIINKDLNDCFNGTMEDNVDLGFVHSSYDDFISKFDPSYESAHEFFRDNLSEVNDIESLIDDVDGSEGSIFLPIHGVKDKLEDYAYENGITVGNLFYAIFAYCLSRFTGGNKVYVNIIEHGRHNDYVRDSVGMFARIIPLVIDCSNTSVNDYVNHVSDLVLDSMANSIYPFRLLASEFNLKSNISFRYNSNLNDMSFVEDDIIITDYAWDKIGEFLCIVNDLEDSYSISLHHSDKYSPQTAKSFVYVFKEILLQLLKKNELKDIDYIPFEDLKLLNSYNNANLIGNCEKLDYSPNVKVYVLDKELRQVPMGAVGELYIAGHELDDDYLNHDEETNNSFIDNPYDNGDYDVLYRTGDMVRFLPDGNLAIVGRQGCQVKIWGNQVELSEIEAVIREMKCVEDVAVQTIKNGYNNELIAYVVSNEKDNDCAEDKIRNYVLNYKPDYMVPSFILFVDEIPLTANDKVDKSILPEVDVDNLHSEYVAPTTETEKAVVDAFEEILNIDNIGIYDDFIKLGGDSLSAINIKYLLDMDLDIKSILNLRTPYKIAQSIMHDKK